MRVLWRGWRLLACRTLPVLFLGCIPADAHQGDQVYTLYEILDGELDLHDGSLADWEAVLGEPTLVDTDFHSLPVGDGARIGPPDLSVRVYLGWNRSHNTILAGVERLDDMYVSYPGADLRHLWRYDGFSLMVDGDHSGGAYDNFNTDEYYYSETLINLQTQQYMAVAASPDGRTLGYPGVGNDWVTLPPYAEAGGAVFPSDGHRAVIEIMVTPFDTLIAVSPETPPPAAVGLPEESTASRLEAGRIVGLEVSFPDFDSGPSAYHGVHNLSGSLVSWRDASTFADFVLVGADERPTAASRITWARIKAALVAGQPLP